MHEARAQGESLRRDAGGAALAGGALARWRVVRRVAARGRGARRLARGAAA